MALNSTLICFVSKSRFNGGLGVSCSSAGSDFPVSTQAGVLGQQVLPSAQAREGILRIRATGERDKRETSGLIKVRMTLLQSRNI